MVEKREGEALEKLPDTKPSGQSSARVAKESFSIER